MNWGSKIIIAFLLFAALLATMVVISMNQEIGLVAKDYYKQEIAYQDQIDRITNYNNLINKPEFQIDHEKLQVFLHFPPEFESKSISGKLLFFRPSASMLDREVTIDPDNSGKQYIDIADLPKGRWKVKVWWETDQKEFYNEIAVAL